MNVNKFPSRKIHKDKCPSITSPRCDLLFGNGLDYRVDFTFSLQPIKLSSETHFWMPQYRISIYLEITTICTLSLSLVSVTSFDSQCVWYRVVRKSINCNARCSDFTFTCDDRLIISRTWNRRWQPTTWLNVAFNKTWRPAV